MQFIVSGTQLGVFTVSSQVFDGMLLSPTWQMDAYVIDAGVQVEGSAKGKTSKLQNFRKAIEEYPLLFKFDFMKASHFPYVDSPSL